MLYYDNMPDVKMSELMKKAGMSEDWSKYDYSLKDFCKKYMDGELSIDKWYLKIGRKEVFLTDFLLPYLIDCGALVPSIKDPINYGIMVKPGIGHNKWYKRDGGIVRNSEFDNLTVGKLGDYYFDYDGKMLLNGRFLESASNVNNIFKFYTYVSLCSDMSEDKLNKIENTLFEHMIISRRAPRVDMEIMN